MKNNPYIKKASILRILTNSNINVIGIVFLLYLSIQLLMGLEQAYLKVIFIILLIADIALIVATTIIEYRYSFFTIDGNKIAYCQPLKKNKCFEENIDDIVSLKIISQSLLIEFKDKKILLDYLSKPKELLKLIEKEPHL